MNILDNIKKRIIFNSFKLTYLIKAYTEGIYADTPANRKLGRVGMSYKEYAEKVKAGKGEELKQKGQEEIQKEKEKIFNSEEFKVKKEKKLKELEDFFKVLDSKKCTFAYLYAANTLDSQLAKEMKDEEGNRVENPMFGKIFKVTTYKLHLNDSYKDVVKRNNPNWEVQSRSGDYEKVKGYEVYFTKSGNLMLSISNFTSTSKYYMKEDDGSMKEIKLSEIQPYLKMSSSLKFSKTQDNNNLETSTGSGVQFRNINVDKIYKLNGGGKSWNNNSFLYSKDLNLVI